MGLFFEWQQLMALVAIIIALAAYWEVRKVARHLHLDDLTPTKRWKKAFEGERYRPQPLADQIPANSDTEQLQFFHEFAGVADWLNEIYGRRDDEEPWSFEDTGKPRNIEDVSRRILIRYNQQLTGEIKLTLEQWPDDEKSHVSVELSLVNARLFEGFEVYNLARTLCSIAIDDSHQLLKAENEIRTAMIATMWELGEGSVGNPELQVHFSGPAAWFRSTKWAKAH